MKSVLLTGASGFIGRQAIPFLQDLGYRVHAVVRKTLPAFPGVDWHRADLLDPEQRRELVQTIRPSHALHFAWQVEHGKFWTSPDNLKWLDATVDLFSLFAANGGRRWVAAGTCVEDSATLYGASKLAANSLLTALARQSNVSAAWGRIFLLYGPHEFPARLVPSVIRSLLDRHEALCSHGRQVRDFMYVEDVARAFVTLLDSEYAGPLDICSGVATPVLDVVEMIGRLLESPDLIRPGAVSSPPGEAARIVGDAASLQALGFTPAYPLEQGLTKTIEWWARAADRSG